MLSINANVMPSVRYLLENAESLGCRYFQLENGVHIVDMGIEVPGGWKSAKLFTEIDMACLGTCGFRDFPLDEEISLPVVEVFIENTELACIASQIAGFRMDAGAFSAIGSGPGRALAALDSDDHIGLTEYRDNYHEAALGFTTNSIPDADTAERTAGLCGVKPENLYLLLHSYNCLVCSLQVSARIVEQAINQMMLNNFDPKQIVSARGYCAVAPLASGDLQAMGWVNDCLLYGGKACFWVRSEDKEIEEKIAGMVTESAKDYGRLFIEMFEEAGRDFYKMDLSIHSPAEIQIFNIYSGSVFTAGKIRKDILKKSIFKRI
jgi:methenyltetrahydromethanopterin cyclohydrolase